MWFCGAHSDVGGGYERKHIEGDPPGRLEPQLADLSLDWMLGKASGAGLRFDPEVLEANPLVLEPRAEIHNSKTGLYRLTPGHDRVIGLATIDTQLTDKPDSTQRLHPSVLARWDADPDYRPEELLRYLERIGDPRALAAR